MCKKLICLILVVGFIQTSAVAAPGDLLQTFLNPTSQEDDSFGISVAVVSNNILIGAWTDDTVATDSGAAYLFDANGALLQTFLPPAPASGDKFGRPVAAIGNDVLVGALWDDKGATDTGAVYKFDSSTGALLHTFTHPSPDGRDRFGWPIVPMGNKILIGNVHNNTGATAAGAVHVFDGSTGALLQTIYNPTPAKGDSFGYAIAVLGDKIVVGSFDARYGYGSGAVYVFDGSTYSLLRTIYNPTPAANDVFGCAVAVVGNNILVGALLDDTAGTDTGAAYLFDPNGTLLQTFLHPTPAKSYAFGWDVTAAGNNILISDYGDDTVGDGAGAVYLFAQNGTLLHTFLPQTPADGGGFGFSIAALGNNVLVGAASTYLFEGCPVGDFEPDCGVDFVDFAVLALAWQSEDGDDNWNQACDISDPSDDVINYNDFAVFTANWLAGTIP